ncbi:MAG: XRE family transcriptional regulator [Nitrospinota bacterium]
MPIGPTLRKLRKERSLGLPELARRAGLEAEELRRIEEGRGDPPLSLLERLAGALGVSPAELFGPPAPAVPLREVRLLARRPGTFREGEFLAVPVVSGEVAAGNARIVDESVEGWALLPHAELRRSGRNLVAVQVQGNSMEPDIPDGAIVVVDRDERALAREGIYALRDPEGGCTVKRAESLGSHLAVIPSNRKEHAIEFWPIERGKTAGDYVVGRVVWMGVNLLVQAQFVREQKARYELQARAEAAQERKRRRKKLEEEF